jgi:hypothetical protein
MIIMWTLFLFTRFQLQSRRRRESMLADVQNNEAPVYSITVTRNLSNTKHETSPKFRHYKLEPLQIQYSLIMILNFKT